MIYKIYVHVYIVQKELNLQHGSNAQTHEIYEYNGDKATLQCGEHGDLIITVTIGRVRSLMNGNEECATLLSSIGHGFSVKLLDICMRSHNSLVSMHHDCMD